MPDQRPPAAPPPAPPRPPKVATPASPAPARDKPFQFGMRTLLIVVTVVALASPLLPGYGRVIGGTLTAWLILVAAPVCLTSAAIYSRGFRQTFFMGAAAPAIVTMISTQGISLTSGYEVAFFATMQLLSFAACGLIAVATRRFIERRGWHFPNDNDRDS